jgi:hypothetical protein
MIVLYLFGFFGGCDRRDRLINNSLVLAKGLAAGGATDKMLLEPLLLLFGQFTRGRNGAEL